MVLFMDFLGRFHPLLLHLPIGILVYAYLQWAYDTWRKKTQPADLNFALIIGCVSAVLSAVSGWFLAEQGGYDQELLDWHKYLGIATTAGTVFLLFAYNLKSSNLAFGLIFTGLMGLLSATGHYGGSITHGKDFLTKRIEKKEAKTVSDIQEAHIFNDIVMPIFERKCVSCHNPEKSKGDLLFHNLEGWQKGGKSGAVLTAGVPSESHILQRAYLPKEDEKHMPPDGKLQLSIDELDFLEWWIEGMKNYEHQVKDLAPNSKVSKYLKSLEGDEFEGIDKLHNSELASFNQYGINASAVSSTTPWINIVFTNKSRAKSGLKKLKSIANNITEIDLSHTDIDDNDLKILKSFHQLRKLNLSNTSIGNRGISNLTDLKKLNNLNVYKTQVDNDVLEDLSKIKKLNKVYVWQTKVEEKFATQWSIDHPHILLDYGVDQSLFGTPKLATPLIDADSELFKDSLSVILNTSNPRAIINYQLKTKTDLITKEYKSPIILKESTTLAAYLTQEGWQNSDTIERSFINVKYEPKSIKLSIEPNEKYPGDGSTTLIDFTKGSESFGDGKWLGFYGEDVIATLDMGKSIPIQSINIGALVDDRSYIFAPKSIKIETSTDGQGYSDYTEKEYPIPNEPTTIHVKKHLLSSAPTTAQFIKIKIESLKKNPKWHDTPGAECWLFLDEIVVE